MPLTPNRKVVQLGGYTVQRGQSSVSGLSSGAFMTVQLHLAHSASFVGAGVVAGGPYRCAEAFRGSAALPSEAYMLNSLYICMAPMTPQMAPQAKQSVALARQAAAAGQIDPIENLLDDRLYIFTGSKDTVVYSPVVANTRHFYEALGVPPAQIQYVDDVPAGHSMITDNPEDSPLGANQPPYLNNGGFMLSHRILRHIYPDLRPPAGLPTGEMVCFDQTEFFGNLPRASMSPFGYAYVPRAVLEGAPARVHIALHGCSQGYNFTSLLDGRAQTASQPPYGNRYFMTTGYADIADSNDLIVLFPQVQGLETGALMNPDGCWDWWGYSSEDQNAPDYFGKSAIQIQAIHAMLTRLGG